MVGWGSCLALAAGPPAAWQAGWNVSEHGGLGVHLPVPGKPLLACPGLPWLAPPAVDGVFEEGGEEEETDELVGQVRSPGHARGAQETLCRGAEGDLGVWMWVGWVAIRNSGGPVRSTACIPGAATACVAGVAEIERDVPVITCTPYFARLPRLRSTSHFLLHPCGRCLMRSASTSTPPWPQHPGRRWRWQHRRRRRRPWRQRWARMQVRMCSLAWKHVKGCRAAAHRGRI